MIGGEDYIGLFKKVTEYLVAMLLILLVGGVIGGKIGYDKGKARCDNVVDTITIKTTDTLFITDTIHDVVTQTYYKTVQVPFYVVDTDTIVDSVWVSLPYEQHFARLDTIADVWYSGYDAKIDSARVYKSTITNYIYVREKRRNNLVGASAGLNDAAILYMYDFGKLAVGASAGYTYEGQPTARAVVGIKF